jgi:DNA-binding MarR family transcriptional regulator
LQAAAFETTTRLSVTQKAETVMYQLTTLEQHQWRSILRGITRLLGQLDRDLDSHSGLSLSEYSVLSALAENGETGVRMTQLAEVAMLSKSRLSHCVDRLVTAGLVTRERVPGDKRGFAAMLTAAGFARLELSTPAHLADVHRYLIAQTNSSEMATLAKIAALMAEIEPETIDLTEKQPAF